MQTGRYRNVPLVDEDGHLVGVVRQAGHHQVPRRVVPRGAAQPPAAAAPAHEGAGRRVTTDDDRSSEPDIRGARAGHDPVRRRFRRRHAAHRARSSPGRRPSSATTSARCPTSRPRSARRPARCRACPASRSASRRSDIHTPGDQPGRARGDEPGGAQDEHRRPAAGRRADRQQRRVHASRTSTRRPTRSNPLTDGSLKAVHRLRDPDLARSTRARSRASR